MEKIKTSYILLLVVVAIFLLPLQYTKAALVPSMTLTTNTGGSSVQLTVIGADPNVPVLFLYPSPSSYQSVTIGTTNSGGYLTTSINSSTYNIAVGAPVYVKVDGQPSQSQLWPSYSVSSATLPLSQTNLTLNVGQSVVITASVSATLVMSNNTNPSAAGISINGNQITVNAFSYGNSNITVCGGNIGCGVIYVNVLSSTASQTAVTFNPTSSALGIGQSQTIQITGTGPFYVSSNSNTSVATALISGPSLVVGGIQTGSATISVCSSATTVVTCNTIPVTVSVLPVYVGSVAATTTLTFGKNEVDLLVGQNQTVPILGGSGSYIFTNNTNPSSVTASIYNGNSLSVTGVAFGSSNITVCQTDNNSCGIEYIYVEPSTTATVVPNTTSTQEPALSSFTVSSANTSGNMIVSGNRLTFTLNANQTINTPVISVAGNALTVIGSGSGPYTAPYTVIGNETQPIPITVTFTNPSGVGVQAYFWIGNSATPPLATNATTAANATTVISSGTGTGTGVGTASGAGNTGTLFTEYLYVGSTGAEVTALQNRLTADGLYSGPITGTFGSLTKAALKAFQTKHGLDPLGVVGKATRGLLNKGM